MSLSRILKLYGIMKRKFKQQRTTIPPISTKETITSHLKSLNTKKIRTYVGGNPVPGFGPAQTFGSIKPGNGIPIITLVIIRYPVVHVIHVQM